MSPSSREPSAAPLAGPAVEVDAASAWNRPDWFSPHRSAGEEQRQSYRRPLRCRMLLVEDGGDESDPAAIIPGDCLNVSSNGLYGTVPLGYGVAVGQRYTFRLSIDERGPEPGDVQVVRQQGVIARAELLADREHRDDRLGIGVRLVGHRSGVIPMPT